MTFCPNCGTEVQSGRKCPDCGLVDEECDNCGTTFDHDGWTCSSCGQLRTFCPDCGSRASEEGCSNCGAEKPALCAQCHSEIDATARECPDCGYFPAKTKYKVGKYAQILGGLVILYGIYDVSSLFTSPAPQGMMMQAAILSAIVFVVVAAVFVCGGWLAKRSANRETATI